jgi:hypothetical protein
VASKAQVDLLYRQIGQLKVENDFWHDSSAMSRAQRCALAERENSALPVSQQCRLPGC